MKILVLLKQTPDTEAKISLSDDCKSINTAGLKFVVNPYDEFAVEEALQIKAKDKETDCEVVICSFGNASARDRILKGLAMGADRGLLISNEGLELCDSLATAKVLAAAIKAEAPDFVLCGKQGIDEDNMHVGVMTAELLEWPHVNVVAKLEISGAVATAEREVEGGQVEEYEVKLPAIFGAHKSLNTPRYTSLPGIMKAKKKPFDSKSPGDFGLDIAALIAGARTSIESFEYPAEKPAGQVFKGDPVETMVANVVKLLREEAKVI